MPDPSSGDGRLRALYAVTAASLETASVLVWAVWLMGAVLLVVLVAAIIAGALGAIF